MSTAPSSSPGDIRAAAPRLDADTCWRAVGRKDPAFDGRFVFGVATTGIYCRPSCAARPAARAHVTFHATPADARLAGFRACKRCHPDGRSPDQHRADAIARACRIIESAQEPPALAALARLVGLSPFHFHKIFKALTGVTPKAYAMASRHRALRQALDGAGSVTQAIYAAGFGSSSRFYERADAMLGMSARSYRKGGGSEVIFFAVGECWLGHILVAATQRGVCCIELGDDPQALLHSLERRFAKATLIGADASFEAVVAQVVALVEQPRAGHALPLDLRGTAFQHRVWQALSEIACGSTASYAEIARAIGAPAAMRAVAGACAANPIAVAIPCHRVVRSDGSLSGYRWGIARKQRLLERERAP